MAQIISVHNCVARYVANVQLVLFWGKGLQILFYQIMYENWGFPFHPYRICRDGFERSEPKRLTFEKQTLAIIQHASESQIKPGSLHEMNCHVLQWLLCETIQTIHHFCTIRSHFRLCKSTFCLIPFYKIQTSFNNDQWWKFCKLILSDQKLYQYKFYMYKRI